MAYIGDSFSDVIPNVTYLSTQNNTEQNLQNTVPASPGPKSKVCMRKGAHETLDNYSKVIRDSSCCIIVGCIKQLFTVKSLKYMIAISIRY